MQTKELAEQIKPLALVSPRIGNGMRAALAFLDGDDGRASSIHDTLLHARIIVWRVEGL